MSSNFQLLLFPFYLFYFSKFSKPSKHTVITIYFFFSLSHTFKESHDQNLILSILITIPFDTTNLLFHFHPCIIQFQKINEISFLKIFRLLLSLVSSSSDKKKTKKNLGNKIVVMDLQRILGGRFARNAIPTRRSGVQIRARFIAWWWKKYTVIKHATRHLSRGQNGRVEICLFFSLPFPPSKARPLSLIWDESHLVEISFTMLHCVESYL